jgi:hypothetical protein
MTVKFFGTVTVFACLALLVAFSALAADPNEWSQEEREAGVKVQEFTRFIKPGHSLSWGVGFFHPDCTLIEDSTPTISKQPNHGTATIEMQMRFPYFPKDSSNAKCNDKKIRMPGADLQAGGRVHRNRYVSANRHSLKWDDAPVELYHQDHQWAGRSEAMTARALGTWILLHPAMTPEDLGSILSLY